MKAQYIKIDEDGTKFYYSDKEMKALNREDGPACEYLDGTKCWFLNGKYHRQDGPAIEYSNGTNIWLLDGIRHRENGPAVEYSNGYKEWWIKGLKYTEEEYNKCFNPPQKQTININGMEFTVEQLNALIKTV